jgi:acetyl/propionyl-CoA carboxylase alpha subunit
MSRALQEYEVLGVQTTVPFFRWMLAQPAFLAAAFHTGYLDELLQQRGGEPFETADKDEEEAAVIGAALHLASLTGLRQEASARVVSHESYSDRLAPEASVSPEPGQRRSWKSQARLEALRSLHAEARGAKA